VKSARGDAVTAERVVRAELNAWDRLDVDDIMSYFTADAVFDGGYGPVSGYDEIRKAVEGFITQLTFFDGEILSLAVADTVVLTERVDHQVFDGKRLDVRCMGAFDVAGDKIRAWRDYYDRRQVLSAATTER